MAGRKSILLAQFPGGGVTCWQSANYALKLAVQLQQDARISDVHLWNVADTPITMVRNRCLLDAERAGADYVVMLDSDMVPDLPYPDARPFWDSSFAFALGHPEMGAVAAPYCGPPPQESVYVFDWVGSEEDSPDLGFQIQMVPRYEAAARKGIQPAAALPTGLILISMAAVAKLPPDRPRFYYEWTDATESKKASTEDVAFTRDLTFLAHAPVYCNWDAWAGHLKTKQVQRPQPVRPGAIPQALRDAAVLHARQGTLDSEPPASPPQRLRPQGQVYDRPPPGYVVRKELAEALAPAGNGEHQPLR